MELSSHREMSGLFIGRTVAEKFIWATVADSIAVSGPSAEWGAGGKPSQRREHSGCRR